MTEIEKLKFRMRNINRNITEYRMSVVEVRDLISEIEILESKLKEMPKTIIQYQEVQSPKILDGGTF
jgi:hypothetical protein